jgi:hypothetical protein
MYRPDPAIVKQLRESDPDLDVRWDEDRCKWIVTCLGKDTVTVQEPNGDFRPLDGRVVTHMREQAWLYRKHYGALHMIDHEIHQRNYRAEQRLKAARRDEFRQEMIEDGHQRVFGVGQFSGWSPA